MTIRRRFPSFRALDNRGNLRKLIALSLAQSLFAGSPAPAGENPDNDYFRLIVATCHTCHSDTGSASAAIPALDGLGAADIKQRLIAWKTGREQATIMNRISRALTDEEIDRISVMLDSTAR